MLKPGRKFELIVLLGALTAFAPLSIDMYLPGLPSIAREFAVPIGVAEHTLATFFLGFAIGQALFGPLADRFGRKPPLYAGLAIYVLASLGCALAQNADTLLLLRFLQAVGACSGVVVARACVRDLFPPEEAPRIFSYMLLVLGVAPLVAPLIGGYMLLWSGWRGIFAVQACVGALAVTAAFFRLPETHGGAHRAMHPIAILRDYMVLLVDRRFIAFVLAGAVSNAGMFAYVTASPHIFINLFHVRAQNFGWFFGTNAVGLVGVAQIAARLLRRYGAERVLLVAQSLQMLAGCGLLICAISGFGGMWGIAGGFFGFVALSGAIMPSAAGLAMRPFGANAGMASALLGTIQFSAAFAISSLVGALDSSTPVPVAAVIAGCSLTGLALTLLARR